MSLTLSVISCPKGKDAIDFCQAKRFDHNGGTIGFLRGRWRDQADWQHPDPGIIVSQIHAIIDYQADRYWLVDVSVNGTIVNENKLHCCAHFISKGNTFRIGDITFLPKFDFGDVSPSDPSWNYVIPEWIQEIISERMQLAE